MTDNMTRKSRKLHLHLATLRRKGILRRIGIIQEERKKKFLL